MTAPATYSDLRTFVSPEAFTATMRFLAWHNRLKLTHMLPPWQALVVAMAGEKQPLDKLQYRSIKGFLDKHRGNTPDAIEAYQRLADYLVTALTSNN